MKFPKFNPLIKNSIINTLLVITGLTIALVSIELYLWARGRVPDWRYATGWAMDSLHYRYGMRPGAYPGLFRSPQVFINSFGTRGPEPKSPVILTMGDSCTFGVGLNEEQIYPFMLGLAKGEVINAGVPGYNSFNGLQVLKHSALLSLKPKLITIYFGWNDHWRAMFTEKTFYQLRKAAQASRLASYVLHKTQNTLWSQEDGVKNLHLVPQVRLSDFENNLIEMIRLARSHNINVVLITPPSEPRLVEKSAWFESHYVEEFHDHEDYVEAVRKVAHKMDAPMIDLDKHMKSLKPGVRAKLFADFVHLNFEGHKVLAELLKPWVKCSLEDSCTVQQVTKSDN